MQHFTVCIPSTHTFFPTPPHPSTLLRAWQGPSVLGRSVFVSEPVREGVLLTEVPGDGKAKASAPFHGGKPGSGKSTTSLLTYNCEKGAGLEGRPLGSKLGAHSLPHRGTRF